MFVLCWVRVGQAGADHDIAATATDAAADAAAPHKRLLART